MALKVLVLRSKLKTRQAELEKFLQTRADLEQQAREVEAAFNELNENSTDDEKKVVEDRIDEIDTQQGENEQNITSAQNDINDLNQQIGDLESKPDPVQAPAPSVNERNGNKKMMTRKFFNLNAEERDRFFKNENVKDFLQRFREMGKAAASESRSVSGADLLIPTEVLDIIRENILDYSKLLRHVKLRPLKGKARQTIVGEVPEAVWTEMCAAINELDFGFNSIEVDGYKISGYIPICRATLDDADVDLATEIIEGLLTAIGIGVDKAILYGRGTKMPLGIVTRLAQTDQPSDYPNTARPWKDLQDHLVTIDSSKTGIEFFKAFMAAAGLAKGNYARGQKVWAMNETTYTQIKIQALNFSADGHIVSFVDGEMPVIGGTVEVLSDKVIPDGNVAGGYGELYLMTEREGSTVQRSDERFFIEDQVVFKGTARYDGQPIIPEAFVAIGIGSAPVTSTTFAGDTANDASLSDLIIGTETLSPTFEPTKYAYTVTAAGTSGAVTAVPTQPGAKLEMTYNGKQITNNQSIKFAEGTHDLVVNVTKGLSTLTYTVSITKAGA